MTASLCELSKPSSPSHSISPDSLPISTSKDGSIEYSSYPFNSLGGDCCLLPPNALLFRRCFCFILDTTSGFTNASATTSSMLEHSRIYL